MLAIRSLADRLDDCQAILEKWREYDTRDFANRVAYESMLMHFNELIDDIVVVATSLKDGSSA